MVSLTMMLPVTNCPFLLLILSLSMFNSDVFPAPDEPIMYSVYPGSAYPDAPFTIFCLITLVPFSFASYLLNKMLTSNSRFSNVTFTGGQFGFYVECFLEIWYCSFLSALTCPSTFNSVIGTILDLIIN